MAEDKRGGTDEQSASASHPLRGGRHADILHWNGVVNGRAYDRDASVTAPFGFTLQGVSFVQNCEYEPQTSAHVRLFQDISCCGVDNRKNCRLWDCCQSSPPVIGQAMASEIYCSMQVSRTRGNEPQSGKYGAKSTTGLPRFGKENWWLRKKMRGSSASPETS